MNESKVMQFIEKFDELYAKNKGVIFQSFQEGGFTLSEQKEIFDGLKTKQKCQLYNTISVDSRKNFYNSLSASDAKNFVTIQSPKQTAQEKEKTKHQKR